MIVQFAVPSSKATSEFLDLNHTSKSMILVSLMVPKFALAPSRKLRRTSEPEH